MLGLLSLVGGLTNEIKKWKTKWILIVLVKWRRREDGVLTHLFRTQHSSKAHHIARFRIQRYTASCIGFHPQRLRTFQIAASTYKTLRLGPPHKDNPVNDTLPYMIALQDIRVSLESSFRSHFEIHHGSNLCNARQELCAYHLWRKGSQVITGYCTY